MATASSWSARPSVLPACPSKCMPSIVAAIARGGDIRSARHFLFQRSQRSPRLSEIGQRVCNMTIRNLDTGRLQPGPGNVASNFGVRVVLPPDDDGKEFQRILILSIANSIARGTSENFRSSKRDSICRKASRASR